MLNIVNYNIIDLFSKAKNRRVFGIGASETIYTHGILRSPDYKLQDIIYKLVDNNEKLWGTVYEQSGIKIPIISVEALKSEISDSDIILIITGHYNEIVKQFDGIEEFNGIETCILNYIDNAFDSYVDENLYMSSLNDKHLIPKTLHYCWFGNKPLPDKYKEYIETWKKYCPDYKIVKWSEDNYDINKNLYIKHAAEQEKWPFVSDYARLDIIYHYGGIYLDCDVEIIKRFDELLRFPAFIGFESTQMVASGLGVGSVKGNKAIEALLRDYDDMDLNIPFEKRPCTVIQTSHLKKMGLKADNTFQMINNDIAILPSEFLCGIRLGTGIKQITEHTFSLHHFCGNWGGKRKLSDDFLSERARFDFEIINNRLRGNL